MLIGMPLLNLPLPVIAGLLFGSATHFEVIEKTRKILTRWTVINRRKSAIRTRSNYKRKSHRFQIKDSIVAKVDKKISPRRILRRHEDVPESSIHPQDFRYLDNFEMVNNIERVFNFCNVRNGVKFECAIPFWKQKSARKIAEGSYGEIYSFRHVDGNCRIFKCVPVDGQHPMCTQPNIPLVMAVPDIVSSKCLSDLNEGSYYIAPNYPIIYSVSLVRDFFPELLTKAWWDYHKSPERLKDPSEHPQPDLYSDAQAYLTIESSFCGIPLTTKVLQNAWVGVSIMTQIVSALSVAEAAYNFEHRDLHLGNILLQNTHAISLKYTIQSCNFSVNTVGYHVFVIDFSLSRIYNDNNVYCVGLDEIVRRSCCECKESTENLWLDHRNMYKIMAEYSKGSWETYMPATNIIWLKYLNENILDYLEKNNPQLTKLVSPAEEHDQMRAIRLLRRWNDSILKHKSAGHLLWNVIDRDNPLISVCDT